MLRNFFFLNLKKKKCPNQDFSHSFGCLPSDFNQYVLCSVMKQDLLTFQNTTVI